MIYDKDCLPTWNELYNEFYLERIFQFDPEIFSHNQPDLYWKRPHRKMILAWACNQLNKMISENKDNIINFINHISGIPAIDVSFDLLEDAYNEYLLKYMNSDILQYPPDIYRCKIPSTNQYSIFISDHPYIDIDDFTSILDMVIVIYLNEKEKIIWRAEEYYKEDNYSYQLITFILSNVIEYFENGVGWKDDEGNLIPSEQQRICEGVGLDPAL